MTVIMNTIFRIHISILFLAMVAMSGCTDADSEPGSDSTLVGNDEPSGDVDVADGAEPDVGFDAATGDAANGSATTVDVANIDAAASMPDAAAAPEQWESLDVDEAEATDMDGPLIGPDERPARVLLPDDYDGSRQLPVVFLFHGYTATSTLQDIYFGLSQRRHDRDFIAVLPDGNTDSTGQQYWNATDYCCDFYGAQPDDVGYFEALLNELREDFAVDPDRIHLLGHSNGSFLAYRLACEHGSKIASIVGLAGSGHWDGADCATDGTVSVLHIHGTNDAVILYPGVIGTYPGAREMTDRWSERNQCSGASSIESTISLDRLIWGQETTQRRYGGCPQNAEVELWTILGGTHIPSLDDSFADRVLDFSLPRTNPDAVEDP